MFLVMRFEIPAAVLERLRARRGARSEVDDIEEQQDAFLLDPGLGPAMYLTSDGRVLVDDPEGFWGSQAGLYEASDDLACGALVAGAKKTGVAELLSLLPARPPAGLTCERCGGSRRMPLRDVSGNDFSIVCPTCSGRGWTTPARP
jgi:hypothetical protein